MDLLRRLAKDEPEYNPTQYLRHVIKRHVQEGIEAYQDNEDCIPLEEDWFEFKGQKTLYRTPTGFDIFKRLVRERAKEYSVDLSLK